MRATIGIVHPAAPGSRSGNRVSALRWACILRRLGYRVVLGSTWEGRPFDALVALHAERSRDSIERFAAQRPSAALVVVATGTDVHRDDGPTPPALCSFRVADRIVVLQEQARAALPSDLHERTRVVIQSARAPDVVSHPPSAERRVCVIAHLREVKAPLFTARAVRCLPESSRIRHVLLGAALDESLGREAKLEMTRNPRFSWYGDRPHAETLALLAGSWLMVSPSRHEGGSNAVSEALACGVGVLASDVPGNTGLVGERHPGLFPRGDEGALRDLLVRAEAEPAFHAELVRCSVARSELVDPRREQRLWGELLREVLP